MNKSSLDDIIKEALSQTERHPPKWTMPPFRSLVDHDKLDHLVYNQLEEWEPKGATPDWEAFIDQHAEDIHSQHPVDEKVRSELTHASPSFEPVGWEDFESALSLQNRRIRAIYFEKSMELLLLFFLFYMSFSFGLFSDKDINRFPESADQKKQHVSKKNYQNSLFGLTMTSRDNYTDPFLAHRFKLSKNLPFIKSDTNRDWVEKNIKRKFTSSAASEPKTNLTVPHFPEELSKTKPANQKSIFSSINNPVPSNETIVSKQKGNILSTSYGDLQNLFFDVGLMNYVLKQGGIKEHNNSYETEQQGRLNEYFAFRPFRRKWSLAQKNSLKTYPYSKTQDHTPFLLPMAPLLLLSTEASFSFPKHQLRSVELVPISAKDPLAQQSLGIHWGLQINRVRTAEDPIYPVPASTQIDQNIYVGLEWEERIGMNAFGVTAGYQRWNYRAPQYSEIYKNNGLQELQFIRLEKLQFDVINLGLFARKYIFFDRQWELFFHFGGGFHLAVSSDYRIQSGDVSQIDVNVNDLSPEEIAMLPTKPFLWNKNFQEGVFQGGSINENSFMTLNIGGGVHYRFSNQWSLQFFPILTLSPFSDGLGPNRDRIQSLNIQLQVRRTIN